MDLITGIGHYSIPVDYKGIFYRKLVCQVYQMFSQDGSYHGP